MTGPACLSKPFLQQWCDRQHNLLVTVVGGKNIHCMIEVQWLTDMYKVVVKINQCWYWLLRLCSLSFTMNLICFPYYFKCCEVFRKWEELHLVLCRMWWGKSAFSFVDCMWNHVTWVGGRRWWSQTERQNLMPVKSSASWACSGNSPYTGERGELAENIMKWYVRSLYLQCFGFPSSAWCKWNPVMVL